MTNRIKEITEAIKNIERRVSPPPITDLEPWETEAERRAKKPTEAQETVALLKQINERLASFK
jgi:hypothetical protein